MHKDLFQCDNRFGGLLFFCPKIGLLIDHWECAHEFRVDSWKDFAEEELDLLSE